MYLKKSRSNVLCHACSHSKPYQGAANLFTIEVLPTSVRQQSDDNGFATRNLHHMTTHTLCAQNYNFGGQNLLILHQDESPALEATVDVYPNHKSVQMKHKLTCTLLSTSLPLNASVTECSKVELPLKNCSDFVACCFLFHSMVSALPKRG